MPPSSAAKSIFPVRLNINGQVELAQIRFADSNDIRQLVSWQEGEAIPIVSSEREHADILEYAALTSKFYNLYKNNKNLVKDLEHLEQIITNETSDARSDLFFLLVLEKEGAALGYAAVRRSWKNTLKLEYLFKNPREVGKGIKIKWTGSSLLSIVVFLANLMDAAMVWGESSDLSATFYQKKGFQFFEEIFYLQKIQYQSFLTQTA
jgi:hypothetical protein